MTRGLFKQGLNAFLLVVIAAFLLVVLYSAIGQQLMPRISEHRETIAATISDALDTDVEMGKLWGEMNVLTPALHIENFMLSKVDGGTSSSPLLSIAAVDAVLDPYQSLINLTPVFKQVRLSGVSVDLRHLGKASAPKATPDIQGTTTAVNGSGLENLIVSLLLQHSVEVNGVSIFTYVNGKDRTLNLEQLALKGDGFHRLINGNVAYGDGDNPIKTSFRFYSEGNPYDLDNFYARGSVDLPRVDFAFWLRELLNNETTEELDASAQLHFEFDKGLLQGARLSLATSKLKLVNQPLLERVNSKIWLKQNSVNDWGLWLESSQFHMADRQWKLDDVGLKLARQADGNRWQIYAKELDLKQTHDLLSILNVLPDRIADRFAEMQPEGKLEHATFVLNTKARADSDFTFASQLANVTVKASRGIPGIENLSGIVAANKTVGRVQFDGPDIRFNIPALYDDPLEVVQGKGQIEWFIEEHQIRLVGDGLDLQLSNIEHVTGGFQAWLAQEDTSQSIQRDSQLLLNLGIKNAQAMAHKSLVPASLNEGLRNWLNDGIQGGLIPEGQLMLFTSINEDAPSPIVQLHLEVEEAKLKYLEEWPQVNELSGQLLLDGERLRVVAPSATSLGGDIKDGVVIFSKDKHQQPALWVALKADGLAQEGLDYFTETPLQEIVNGALDDWAITGKQKYAMALKVPMGEGDEELTIDLTSALDSSDLRMNSINLGFDDVTGVIGYSSALGLYSKQLNVELWGQDTQLSIQTEFPDQKMVTTFDIQGSMSSEGLKGWTRLGLLEGLSGSAPMTGQFILDTRDGEKTGLVLNSTLEGIALNLPEPYGLETEQQKSMRFELQLDDPILMKLAYGDDMNLAMTLKDGSLGSGQVYLGKTEAYIPADKGLMITGHLGEIDTSDWIPVWERIEKQTEIYDVEKTPDQQKEDAEKPSPLRQILISTDALVHDGTRYESIKIDARHNAGDWRLDIDAPVAKGTILKPQNDVLDINLAYVHLPKSEETSAPSTSEVESEESDEQAVDPLENIDPKAFPAMKLKVGEFFVGATNYGNWDVGVLPDEAGALFTIQKGHIKKLDVNGEIYWYKKENHHTQAKLNLATKDVGGIQKEWRMKPAIEAEKGKANLILDWSGSPAAFNIETLTGDANFKLQDGSFVDAKDAEALNAFGLLNFASIGRRLRLDFRDLYTEGLAFDRFEAKTQLDNGVLTIIDTMDVEGPAAKFATSGSINLNTKELDQQLSVTFPVSSTLPLVAILAGFAPPVAASIFVGERLVGDEIERFTSATYQVSGPWDDPNLELKKRFDNEIEGKKKQTFWHRMKDVFGLGKD